MFGGARNFPRAEMFIDFTVSLVLVQKPKISRCSNRLKPGFQTLIKNKAKRDLPSNEHLARENSCLFLMKGSLSLY